MGNNNSIGPNNSASNNEIAYVKGVDFNSQQKYDFNILNNLPIGSAPGQQPSALSNAGLQVLQ